MSWIIGRSAGSTQPSLGRVSLSLHSCQNPQFEMTINNIPLLEITDFGPPARGGHFVRQSHKGRENKLKRNGLTHLSLFRKHDKGSECFGTL